ncbi:MAG TPA: capsid cement protein, partial [Patescibacteria group bacterium]|nr:capsid cement protein [Patescibacteria group bacterium]
ATTISMGAAGTSTINLNAQTLHSSVTSINVFTTTSTTVSAFTAATSLTMGAGTSTTITLNGTTGIALNTAAITSSQTTVALLNSTVTTVNAFQASSTALNIGSTGGAATFGNAGAYTIQGVSNYALTVKSQGSGALTLTAAAASTWSSAAGLLTISGFGGLTLTTPTIAAGPSTNVIINTGPATSSGNTGTITIQTGASTAATSGNITVDNGTSSSGTPYLYLGNTNARNVTIGNSTAATAVNINGGSTGNINLVGVTNINNSGATTTNIGYAGTGAVNIGNTTGTLALGANVITLPSTITTGSGTALCQSGDNKMVKSAGSPCTNNSSIRFKENVQSIGNGLDVLNQLRPVSFDWKTGYGMDASGTSPLDFGFIAEEVNNVLPWLVSHDDSGQISGLNYIGFIPIIANAAQQEEQQINVLQSNSASQQTQIAAMQSDVANLASGLQNGNLTVNNAAIYGNADVYGSINIRGPTTLTDLTVTGTTTTQELVVADIATINILKVTGPAEFGGDLNLTASVNTKQAITKKFLASGPIAAGSIVIIDSTKDGYVTTTTNAEDTKIIGVAIDAAINAGDEIKVAIGGSVQVQADQFTAISSGDMIVSDVHAGEAKAVPNPKVGSILGKATSAKDVNNYVWVLITLQ